MKEIPLDVFLRKEIGTRKLNKTYRQNFVPAVVYGAKMESLPIKVDRKGYGRIMRLHKGENVIFHLNVVEDEKKINEFPAMVKEEQNHPVTDQIVHLDFQRISLTEEIEVKVPVTTKGEAAGVKQGGGSLEHVMWELEVICLPTQIPAKIEIDVTNLNIGDAIHVKDIVLPPGVRTKHNPDAILVTVVPPMKDEPTTPPLEGEAPKEPEVLREKKKEEAPEAKAQEKTESKKSEAKKPEAKA